MSSGPDSGDERMLAACGVQMRSDGSVEVRPLNRPLVSLLAWLAAMILIGGALVVAAYFYLGYAQGESLDRELFWVVVILIAAGVPIGTLIVTAGEARQSRLILSSGGLVLVRAWYGLPVSRRLVPWASVTGATCQKAFDPRDLGAQLVIAIDSGAPIMLDTFDLSMLPAVIEAAGRTAGVPGDRLAMLSAALGACREERAGGTDLSAMALPGTAPACPGLEVLVDTEHELHLRASGLRWSAGVGLMIAACLAACPSAFCILSGGMGRGGSSALAVAGGLALTLACYLSGIHLIMWREHIFVDGGGLRRICRGLFAGGRRELIRGQDQVRRFDVARAGVWEKLTELVARSEECSEADRRHYLIAEGPEGAFKLGTALNEAAAIWLGRRIATIWGQAALDGQKAAVAHEARERR